MDRNLEDDQSFPVEESRSKALADWTPPGLSAPGQAYLVVDQPKLGPDTILSFLRRRRWTLLASFFVIVSGTIAFTATRPRVYRSFSTFLIEAPDTRSEAPPLAVLERAGRINSMVTEGELMRSARVIEPVVRELALQVSVETDGESKHPSDVFRSFSIDDQALPGSYRISERPGGEFKVTREGTDEVLGTFSSSALNFAGITVVLPAESHDDDYLIHVASLKSMVSGVQSQISAGPKGTASDIMQLLCTSSTPEGAQSLCESVTRSYLSMRSEMQRAEATAAVEFLEEQLAAVAQRLKVAEDSLAYYQERNLAVALEAQAGQEVGQQASFRARRDELIAQRAALAQLIERIETGPTGQGRDLASLPTFVQSGNPVIGDLLGSLVQLENRRAELAKSRTERNPDILAIDNRIADIENQLKSIATNYEGTLGAQISSLDGIVRQASGRMASIPEKVVEAGRLSRQVAMLDEHYRGLQTQLREAHMAESISLPTVRVVDSAYLPSGYISPRLRFNLALGIMLGLAFGLGLALLQEFADTRIRERKQLEQDTGIPVLAMIPGLRQPGPILPVGRPGGGNGSPLGLTRRSPQHDIAREGFWSLMTDLEFATRRLQNGGLGTLAITSTTQGEGKTFSACNLALAQANASKRTLLIDADLRGKGATRFFGIKTGTTPGLSNVLAGAIESSQAWQPFTVDGRGELFVLPAGTDTDHREFLNIYKLDRLLREAEKEFDLVVVDTPPLNIVSDAATVASSVDGVIIVVRGGFTDRAALDLTLDRLKRSSARIMGIVLNDVELPRSYTSYSHANVEDEESV